MMKKLFPCLLLLFFIISAKAQSGDISGKVTDQNAFGIKSADVIIVDSLGNSTGRGSKTDTYGNYSISPLAPGKYNVKVTGKGFDWQLVKGVVVGAEKSTFIDFHVKTVPSEPKKRKK